VGALDELYREYLVELYRHPHNYGLMDAPSVRQEGQNPLCGDEITVDLQIRDGRVEDARFVGRGCAVSQAAASILTDLMKGKAVAEVLAMTHEDMLAAMGFDPQSLTPARHKCAALALKTVQEGLRGQAVLAPEPSGG
jgi:nitrogen fixation NifU-like protein